MSYVKNFYSILSNIKVRQNILLNNLSVEERSCYNTQGNEWKWNQANDYIGVCHYAFCWLVSMNFPEYKIPQSSGENTLGYYFSYTSSHISGRYRWWNNVNTRCQTRHFALLYFLLMSVSKDGIRKKILKDHNLSIL